MDSPFNHLAGSFILIFTATVFVCESPGEAPLFLDLPCPHGTALRIDPAPLIQSVGISAESTGEAAFAKGSNSGATAKRNPSRPATIWRVQLCETARTGLRAVQLKKRKGHSIAEAAQLESELREQRETIRENCW